MQKSFMKWIQCIESHSQCLCDLQCYLKFTSKYFLIPQNIVAGKYYFITSNQYKSYSRFVPIIVYDSY